MQGITQKASLLFSCRTKNRGIFSPLNAAFNIETAQPVAYQ
jgi:hypothetical protein